MADRVIRDDGLYADEVAAMVAGADQRRNWPRTVDDIEAVRAALADAHEACTGPCISRNVAELLSIPLDDPDVEPAPEDADGPDARP